MAEQPTYLVLVCEGRRCVPIVDLEDVVATEAVAVTEWRRDDR